MWQPDNIKFVKIIFSSLHSINAIYHKLSLYDFSWKGIYLCISFHYELKRSEWLDKKKLLINKQLSFRSHWDWWHSFWKSTSKMSWNLHFFGNFCVQCLLSYLVIYPLKNCFKRSLFNLKFKTFNKQIPT